MIYFFILGNHPNLSMAELQNVLNFNPDNSKKFFLAPTKNHNAVFLWETKKDIDAPNLIKLLGGTIKIGVIDQELTINNKDLNTICIQLITKRDNKEKINFGLSSYGDTNINFMKLGMETKNGLREAGHSCRFVTSKDANLSSVVVEQNNLIASGAELIFIRLPDSKSLFLGHTLAVQPFKELSKRDYGRPARDDLSGMLPPKLAQIMINLAGIKNKETALILDPFCGSGTILTEAMLMGYKKIIGSDISKKAIQDSKENIFWIKKNSSLNPSTNLYTKSVQQMTSVVTTHSMDAIITEPYLGPQGGLRDINKITHEITILYNEAFKVFQKIIKPNGRIVMVWPIFMSRQNNITINPNILDFKTIKYHNYCTQNYPQLNIKFQNSLIYGRPGQLVWRMIVSLKKN